MKRFLLYLFDKREVRYNIMLSAQLSTRHFNLIEPKDHLLDEHHTEYWVVRKIYTTNTIILQTQELQDYPEICMPYNLSFKTV